MNGSINIEFGKTVAKFRKQIGISQEELAYKCGVHRTYIGALERGEKSPTLNTIEKIAAGLGVKMIDLFNS